MNNISQIVEAQLLEKLSNQNLSTIKVMTLQHSINNIKSVFAFSFHDDSRELLREKSPLEEDGLEYFLNNLPSYIENRMVNIDNILRINFNLILKIYISSIQEYFELHIDTKDPLTILLFEYISEREKIEAIYNQII